MTVRAFLSVVDFEVPVWYTKIKEKGGALPMNIEKICEQCEKLNREFNTAAREMNGRELAALRTRLMMKYDAAFVNGWTVRLNRRVEDVFTAEQVQVWEQTGKGVFGKRRSTRKLRLALRSQALSDTIIKCIASAEEPPCIGQQVRVCGELELVLFLHPEGVQWKSAEFLKNVRITQVDG